MSIIDRIRGDGIQPTFTRDTVRSRQSCGHFFVGWLRTMWLDLLTMAVLGFATLGVCRLLSCSSIEVRPLTAVSRSTPHR